MAESQNQGGRLALLLAGYLLFFLCDKARLSVMSVFTFCWLSQPTEGAQGGFGGQPLRVERHPSLHRSLYFQTPHMCS